MAKKSKEQLIADAKRKAKERAKKIALKVAVAVVRGAGKGIVAAKSFIVSRVKEELSVPAPRVRIKRPDGTIMYKATTKALPFAPPRKLSGRLRASFQGYMETPTRAVIGSNAKGYPSRKYRQGYGYPKHHEVFDPMHPTSGKHQFIKPVMLKYKKAIALILNTDIRKELGK